MRDSNYKSVGNNKAAVTITTSLYDRRALDVTSDKPLVNSLNHLTYLVSSSAKVREALAMDGGIERLVEILHECHNSTFNASDNIFNSEKKLLTAWKWTLTFQCLVLIGTRGTEKIRQKVVKAGILPIIATVLDNYLTLHGRKFKQASSRQQSACRTEQDQQSPPEHTFEPENQNDYMSSVDNFESNISHSSYIMSSLSIPNIETPSLSQTHASPTFFDNNSLTSDDYDHLSIDQLIKLIKMHPKCNNLAIDIRRRYLIASAIKKLKEEKQNDILDDSFFIDTEYEMDSNLQFLSNLYLQEYDNNRIMVNTKVSPRNFTETGVVIPRDDDIIWSLQLLAYISKYPYLKEVLQHTHFVIDMSIRDKQLKLFIEKQMKLKLRKNLAVKLRPTLTPKSRKCKTTYLERFSASASNSPQMLNDINTIDSIMLDEDKLELYDKSQDAGLTENAEVEDESEECEVDEDLEEGESTDNDDDSNDNDNDEDLDKLAEISVNSSNYLGELYDSVTNSETFVNDLEREIALVRISEKMNKIIDAESRMLVCSIIDKRKEQRRYLKNKWEYDNYSNFDVDEVNVDQDDSLVEYKKVNLFPIVEKFTFLSGTDMYYWSGVIMRNSCRRNEYRGGVRQCGNLECGKWEKYPREFSKCRRCKRTKYCSRDCQMKAWHCHRNWCIPSTGSASTQNSQSTNNDLSQSMDDDHDSQRDQFSDVS